MAAIFEKMQIRIIHVFGYIRFIFNEENHLHMLFEAIL